MLKHAMGPSERREVIAKIRRHFPEEEKQNERVAELKRIIEEGLDPKAKRALYLLYQMMLVQSDGTYWINEHESKMGRKGERYVPLGIPKNLETKEQRLEWWIKVLTGEALEGQHGDDDIMFHVYAEEIRRISEEIHDM